MTGNASGGLRSAALVEDAIRNAQSGHWQEAIDQLGAAIEASPNDLIAWITLAGVRGRSGDAKGELAAIQQVLAIEPYYVPALLLKGNWYQGQGDSVLAATSYMHALEVSGPDVHWPDQIHAELVHARDFVTRHENDLLEHLARDLADDMAGLDTAEAARWREAIHIRAGKSRPHVSNSNQLCIPRLPAVPFFDRGDFPFLEKLESNTGVILEEMQHALEKKAENFQPYIAYRPGEPVNQWDELNHSNNWNAFHLWKGGSRVEENLALCPDTAGLLEQTALCTLDGLCPNVFFSALAPRTRIPPHFGESNARVVAHLPLVVPPACGLRVGFEKRSWKLGQTLIFDDTLEHEAWNDSDELRVVMIFDLWNPLLSEPDRRLASRLAKATREFAGQDPASP